MKSKTTLFGLALVLMALVMWMPGATAGVGGNNPLAGNGGSPFGFGQKIAGTWVGEGPFGGSLTLFADGNVSAISGACCGAGGGANIQSEAFGNWVRTGTHQITLRAYIIGTRYDEDAQPANGFVAAPAQVLDFAQDFESYTGILCTTVFNYELGDPIPNVETDVPDFTVGPFPLGDNRRLSVFLECP